MGSDEKGHALIEGETSATVFFQPSLTAFCLPNRLSEYSFPLVITERIMRELPCLLRVRGCTFILPSLTSISENVALGLTEKGKNLRETEGPTSLCGQHVVPAFSWSD